jgi:hypothetical protein
MSNPFVNSQTNLVGDDNLNIDSRLEDDVGQLTNNLRRGVKIKDTLVHAHLPSVEGVGTLTAWRLADHQADELGGHADRTGDLEVLLKSLVLELSAHLLEGLDLGGGQGDADAVDGGLFDTFSLQRPMTKTSQFLKYTLHIMPVPWT